MLKKQIIGIGDFLATNEPGESIRTMGLGSCVAVILLDRETRTVAMAHIALPDSSIKPEITKKRPAYFADTGVKALLEEMNRFNVSIEGNGVIVKLVGGADVLKSGDLLDVGKRNVLNVKKQLWKHRLGPHAEDTGRSLSRSVLVDVDSGSVIVSSPGRGDWRI